MLIPAGHLGNFAPGEVVGFKAHTRRDDTFAPADMAGSPAFAVYKRGDAGEVTDGLTVTLPYDSKTGLIDFELDTGADEDFYAFGHFQVVCTAGTVNSVSHIGAVAASFVLDNAAVLQAEIAGALTLIKDVTDRFTFEGDEESERVAAVLAAADHTAFANALQDLEAGVETGLTRRQLDRITFAALAGLLSGMAQPVPPGPVLFKNKAGNKNRITATLDGSGNRLTIVFDLS